MVHSPTPIHAVCRPEYHIGSIAETRDRGADVQGRKRPVATVIMHVWSVPQVQGRKRPVDDILTSNRQETGILTSNV